MSLRPMTLHEVRRELYRNIEIVGGCWEWCGPRNKDGYGIFVALGERSTHRLAYKLLTLSTECRAIPRGLCVCHKCDNPPCINPAHLFLGTRKQNQEDMVRKGRSTWGTRNARCRMSEASVMELRKQYARGKVSMTQLALTYGISIEQVSRIIDGKRWARLPVLGGPKTTSERRRVGLAAHSTRKRR